jgi:ABC-type branched-subunit amino acid transport system substrate-binding protein
MEAGGNVRRGLVALAVVGLLTAGCGARWTDDQRASVVARGSGADAAGADVAAQGAGAGTAAGAAASSGATASGAASGAAAGSTPAAATASGGDVPGAAVAAGGGALPCSAPSDAPGVTPTEIAIGSISSLSGPVPGLGEPAAAAVRAYVAFRNATGGVCGRQLVLQAADDTSDSARYRTVLADIEPRVIGFAGGLSLGDDGSADIIRDRAIPMIASRSAEGVQGQPTVFDLNPPFADTSTPIGKYDYLYAQGAHEVALVYLAVDASRAEAQTQRSLMEASGMQIVTVVELPVATLSFDSAARSVANSGAQYLLFIGAISSNASMAQAMEDTGYELQYMEFLEFAYGTNFAEFAGEAGEGATMWIRTIPNEEAGSNPQIADFVQWMDTTNPGTDMDPLAAESWVAARLLVEGLEALPGPITRQALVDHLRSVETYDAGGMLGPILLGQQRNQGCSIGMQLHGGTWQRLAPATGFLC